MVRLILYQEILRIISCLSFIIIYAAMDKQSKGGVGLVIFPWVYHMEELYCCTNVIVLYRFFIVPCGLSLTPKHTKYEQKGNSTLQYRTNEKELHGSSRTSKQIKDFFRPYERRGICLASFGLELVVCNVYALNSKPAMNFSIQCKICWKVSAQKMQHEIVLLGCRAMQNYLVLMIWNLSHLVVQSCLYCADDIFLCVHTVLII